jgi:hypothetical protein
MAVDLVTQFMEQKTLKSFLLMVEIIFSMVVVVVIK